MFWGSDIRKDVTGCVEDIKEVIFQTIIERGLGNDFFTDEYI